MNQNVEAEIIIELRKKVVCYENDLIEDPEEHLLHYAKAEALVKLAKETKEQSYYNKATEAYNKAIELSLQNRMYLVGRSKLYITLEKYDLAAQDIIDAQKAHSTRNTTLDKYCNTTARDIIKLPAIKAELKKLVASGKTSLTELKNLFPDLILEFPDIGSRLTDFDIKSIDPELVSTTQRAAPNQIKLKHKTAKVKELVSSIESYEMLLEEDSNDDEVYYIKAEDLIALAMETGDKSYYGKALTSYEKAIKLSPQNQLYLANRSKLYVILEKYDLATQDILDAQKSPNTGDKILDRYCDTTVRDVLRLPVIKAELKKLVMEGKTSLAELKKLFPDLVLELTELGSKLTDFDAKVADGEHEPVTHVLTQGQVKAKADKAKSEQQEASHILKSMISQIQDLQNKLQEQAALLEQKDALIKKLEQSIKSNEDAVTINVSQYSSKHEEVPESDDHNHDIQLTNSMSSTDENITACRKTIDNIQESNIATLGELLSSS